MSPDARAFVVRSYGLCFRLERRLHKIDRWRIPVPYGIPVRGIAYAVAGLALMVVLSGLPLVGPALGVLHPAIRLLVVPVAAGYFLCQLRVDGRSAHAAGLAWLRHSLGQGRIAAFRAADPQGRVRVADVALAPDERSARYRPAVVRGPTSVLLRYPASAAGRGSRLELRQSSKRPMWRGKRITLRSGQRLVVR